MNIEAWVNEFEREKNSFDFSVDALETNNRVLMPGRFYILRYMPKSKDDKNKILNTRPIILSLGLSKKDPESFLCIDLCVMPRKIRIKFLQMFYDMFDRDISQNIKEFPFTDMADKQKMIKEFNYQNLEKIDKFYPVMNAIKRYKIECTRKIYALSYLDIYKVCGEFADENWFINGNIRNVQKEFIEKSKENKRKKRK